MAAITMVRSCRVDGCIRPPIKNRTICAAHRSRLQRYGDPDFVKPKGSKPREDANGWQGENVKYNAAHSRVRHLRGNADTHECLDCGGGAKQWSLRHDAEALVVEGRRFSLNEHDYDPRCVACHIAYDRKGG